MPSVQLNPYFGKRGQLFPPLPEIESPVIRLQVFTHRSFYARPIHVFEDTPDDPSPDNERLEHLGDTVLGLAITTLLTEKYPFLRVGPATKVRAMMVANSNLAEISVKYKLPEHLRLHPAQAITLKASPNIQADVFESYVGGVYLDQGVQAVQAWVNKLFAPYAASAYEIARQQHSLLPLPPSAHLLAKGVTTGIFCNPSYSISSPPPHPEPRDLANMPTIGHLALFNQQIQRTNRQVEWIYSDGTEVMVADDDDANTNAATAADDGDSGSVATSDSDGKSSDTMSESDLLKGRTLDGAPAFKKRKSAYTAVALPREVLTKGSKATPVWYVKVMVDGEYYGRGRGISKKAARNEAAKEGLKALGIEVCYVRRRSRPVIFSADLG
ncbi:hypothetical protein D9619_000729 [Psilocybe cf. subviscida]|uniref:RNase III domain-containing protein n=1 Tax=Psilocybe cf. subviscida TaxID=2480587 RepID=A0A8H5BDJ8_9AGAR|nr:hypothetical protein D9619_000729 [Psilocybe cf. subviscida]